MIFIRSEDRNLYGFGNRSRAIAIAQFCKRNNLEYSLIYSNKSWGKELSKDFNCINISSQSGKKDEALDILKKITLTENQINFIFCDGNRFTNAFFLEIKKKNLKTLLIDDIGDPIRDSVDCVLNPNVYAKKELYSKWNTKIFAGPQNVLLREEFFRPIEKTIFNKSILISLGGTVKAELIKYLKKKLTNEGFKVIISKKLSAVQMVDAIDESSIVICGASVSLHEVFARKRIPIPVYQVEDQKHFINYFKKNKLPFVMGLNRKPKDVALDIFSLINFYLENETKLFYRNYQFNYQSLNNPLKAMSYEI